MFGNVDEAAAAKLVGSIEIVYRELKEEWNFRTKEKIEKYFSTMIQKYGEVKTILHGSIPKPFYSVYYPLTVSINGLIRTSPSVQNIFKNHRALIVTSDAGSGKSMLIKHLFNNSIIDSYCIPFVIELRYLNSKEQKLESYIDTQIKVHLSDSPRIKRRLLDGGKLVFFLDGYDEVRRDLREDIVHSLKNLTETHSQCKFIVSTRPYTDIEMLSNFAQVQIMPLSTRDVPRFIRLQVSDADLADKIAESVREAAKSKFSSFLRNPLLLTLYILTYKNSSEVPSKASIFYRRVVDSLFIEHDSKTKIGFQRERISGITYDRFDDVMKKFAFVSFFSDRFAFDKEYAVNLFSQIISKDSGGQFRPEDFIDDLKLAFSLWIDDSGQMSFAHKSLQEYFCALYIKDMEHSKKGLVYQKLKQKTEGATDQLNMLSILDEVDHLGYLIEFYIPVLEEIRDLLRENNSVSRIISLFFKRMMFASSPGKHAGDHNFIPKMPNTAIKYVHLLQSNDPPLFMGLHDLLKSEISKMDSKVLKENSKSIRRLSFRELDLASPTTALQSLMDKNELLSEYLRFLQSSIDQLIECAKHEVRIAGEISDDLLSLI
jgi:predicted NACHT family NTPase